jgi:hypothetical protein
MANLGFYEFNVSPLCGTSMMSYHFDILLMLLFVPSQQLRLLFVCKPALQTRNGRKVPKPLFRPAISSIVAFVITTIFSIIELVESTNRAFLKVFILIPMI